MSLRTKILLIVVSVFIFVADAVADDTKKSNEKDSQSIKSEPSVIAQKSDKNKAAGLITSNWGDYFNVTRLQTRVSDNGRLSFNQSTFVRFPSKLFIAQSFDHTEAFKKDPDINFFEMFFGGQIKFSENPELLGWVTRVQASTGIKPEYSGGLQYNISEHSSMKSFFKKNKITTFIQVFPLRSNDKLGKYDMLHYYSFPIYKTFYVRGYNRWFYYENKKDYFLLFQDFVLPINSKFDSFVRHTYQNRNDIQYGVRGSDISFGIRFNHSF